MNPGYINISAAVLQRPEWAGKERYLQRWEHHRDFRGAVPVSVEDPGGSALRNNCYSGWDTTKSFHLCLYRTG